VVVYGDAIRLQQVISNVLGNAIKFTPPDGTVDLELERDGSSARIVVSDDGEGIESELLPHVFEPFRQGHDVRKRKGGGLGLGLTIVKNIVEQHRGHVAVRSEGRGCGTTFTVILPVEDGETATAPRIASRA